MPLRAGGAPALIRRDLGTPGAIAGARAYGSALYGARLTTALTGTVLMRAGDGAARMALTQGGASGLAASLLPALTQSAAAVATSPGTAAVAASLLPALTQSAQAAATVPAYAGAAVSVLPGLTQAATAVATAPGAAAVAASVLPGLTQAAQAAATLPAYSAAAQSVLPALSQAALAVAVLPLGPALRAHLRLVRPIALRMDAARLLTAQMMAARLIRATLVLEDGMTTDPILAGEALRVKLQFTGPAGAPILDATGVQLRARPPTGPVQSYAVTPGAGPGEWVGTIVFDAPGRWWVLGECTGPTPALAQMPVVVAQRAVPA